MKACKLAIAAVTATALVSTHSSSADILLSDSFDSTALGSGWNAVESTALIGSGNAYGGMLFTDFEVTPSAESPLHISGTFNFTGTKWAASITTRSSGVWISKFGPDSGLRFEQWSGQATNEFTLLNNPPGSGYSNWQQVAADSSTAWTEDAEGQWDFLLIDDGSTISFTSTERANPSNTSSATWSDSTPFDSNFVLITLGFEGNAAQALENITIQTVPEPGSLALLGVSSLFMMRRRS